MNTKLLAGAVLLAATALSSALYAADDAAKPAAAAPAAAASEKPADQAADQSAAKKDYVMVKYQDRSLKKSEVEKEVAAAIPGGQALDFSAFPPATQDNILRNIISQKILLEEANKAGVENSEELKARFEAIKRQLVMDLYLRNKAKELVKDEDLKKLYDEKVKQSAGKEEVKASHILVDNEKEAKELYKKIKGGADFAELAKEKSKDPGARANGGDLGYFTEDQMVKEFSTAAFKLKQGEVSQPVKSEFGWHVIKLVDRRKATPPSFEDMKPTLQAEIQGKVVSKYLNELFDKAGVEVLDEKGAARKLASLPEAPAAAAHPQPAAAPAENKKQ